MINVSHGYFKLDTKLTTYMFRILPTGAPEHVYYDVKIDGEEDFSFIEERKLFGCGVRLNTEWMGGQDPANARIMYDFGSRLYTVEKI